jgi:hypothetical protein
VDSERLQSIATIQKRLQALLDEGRLLRQSLEAMRDLQESPRAPDRRRGRKSVDEKN